MFVVTVSLSDWSFDSAPIPSKSVAQKLARVMSEGNPQTTVMVSEAGGDPICIYQGGTLIFSCEPGSTPGDGGSQVT
jgi:hypothetical protein